MHDIEMMKQSGLSVSAISELTDVDRVFPQDAVTLTYECLDHCTVHGGHSAMDPTEGLK